MIALALALLVSQSPAKVTIPEDTTNKAVLAGDYANKAIRVNCVTGCSGSSGLTDTQLRASPVPVSGTVTASGSVSVSNFPATQPVSGTVTATGPLTDTQLRASAVPVSLSSTTVTGSVAVTGPLTDTQLRASAVPVSLASTTVTGSVAVTGPLTDTQLRATAVPVSMTSTTVTGTVTSQGADPIGTAHTIQTNAVGAVWVQQASPAFPLNPFLSRCNAVRRANCQP